MANGTHLWPSLEELLPPVPKTAGFWRSWRSSLDSLSPIGALAALTGDPWLFLVMTWGNWKKKRPNKLLVAKNPLVSGCTIFRHHLAGLSEVLDVLAVRLPTSHVKTFSNSWGHHRWHGWSHWNAHGEGPFLSSSSLMTPKGASMCRYTWSSGSRYRR